MPKPLLYLEDCTPGRRMRSPGLTVTEEDIVAYARQFDPQPFHLGHESARGTFFGELIASGWHTASLTMRLMTELDEQPAWGIVGKGVENLTWSKPVRPGDRLHLEVEVLEARRSRTRPGVGTVKIRIVTLNQDGDVVQTMEPNIVVPAREQAG